MMFENEDDCNKILDLCIKNKIPVRVETSLKSFLILESEFRLRDLISDSGNLLLDYEGNKPKCIDTLIEDLSKVFYEDDYIIDNDNLSDLESDFLESKGICKYSKDEVIFIDINI